MRIIFLFIVVLAIAETASAQKKEISKEAGLSKNSKNELIDTLLKKMKEIYIFPEVSANVEKTIRQNQKKGVYKNIIDAKVLADTLTNHLLAITHDKHIQVNYSEEAVPVESGMQEPSPEDVKRMQRSAAANNFGFKKLEILDGNIGYMRIDGFSPAEMGTETAAACMNYLSNTNALIFDLRQNRGGNPSMINFLLAYFFEKPTHLNDLYWRMDNRTIENWTAASVPGKTYLNKPLFILTSKTTISAGEEFTYDLQSYKKATIIGEPTAGAANPGWDVRIGEHFTIFIPNGRAINPITKTNWEGTGVKPDIEIKQEDALQLAHVSAIKKVLETSTDESVKERLSRALKKLEK